MAETMLTCKPASRKVVDGGDSSSSDSDVPEERSEKQIEEENQRKKELEKEQRRLQKRIERKRRRTEEVGPSSSSTSAATASESIIQEQFQTILKQLNSMKLGCAVCKSVEKPKNQLDFLKAIYIKVTDIEKLLKDVQS